MQNDFDLMQFIEHEQSVEDWLSKRIEYLYSLTEEERRIENREYREWYRRTRPKKDWIGRLRQIKKGVPFELVPNDLFVPNKCVIKEIPIRFHDGDYTPRILLIDKDLGYVKGNYIVVSQVAARYHRRWWKLDRSERVEYREKYLDLFREFCEYQQREVEQAVKEDPKLLNSPWYRDAVKPLPEP
jgi:hypothetical protein